MKLKTKVLAALFGASALGASAPALATTISCNVAVSQCTASLAGTASPNHLSVTVSEASFSVSMCDSSSGSCVWRSCSLTDDGTNKYQNMQKIALQGETFNALNYGRFFMQWDASGKCTRLTSYAP